MNKGEITKKRNTIKHSINRTLMMMLMMLCFLSAKSTFAQIPQTQLRTIDCGKINLSPVAQIQCIPVANANLYQWEFRDVNNNNIIGTKNTSTITFTSNMVGFLQWNTQYNCAVRARVGQAFGDFGQSCVMGIMQNPATTGVMPTSLRPQFCNANSLLLASYVSCIPVPMGTLYQFEFKNTLSQQITTVTQSSIYLYLANPTLALQIGQSYEVRTKAFVFNTWSNVTSVCLVAIELPISNVVASYELPSCIGTSLHLLLSFQGGVGPLTYAWTGPNGYSSAIQNPIVLNPANGIYSVTVTGSFGSGSASTSITLNTVPMVPVITGDENFCINNIATLDAGAGYTSYMWSNGMQTQTTVALLAGNYSVTVTNSFGCTSSSSVNIPACFSNVANTNVRDVDCGQLNFTPSAEFACDQVVNATNYHWEFRNPATLELYAVYTSTDVIAFGDITTPPLQFNTQYVARVRAQVAGEWGNYGALCTIGLAENPAITGVLPTQLKSEYCNDSTLTLDSTIACLPVSMGDIYEFEFTDLLDSSIAIKQSDLIYLSLDSVSPMLVEGHTYAVRVRAFVYNTWSNFGSTCNVTIDSLPTSAATRTSSIETIAIKEQVALSFVNKTNLELLAYPNPFENYSGFIIRSTENKSTYVYLFNALGQQIWSKQTTTNQYEQFNTQDLAPGLYFISTTANSDNAIKIIKTK